MQAAPVRDIYTLNHWAPRLVSEMQERVSYGKGPRERGVI